MSKQDFPTVRFSIGTKLIAIIVSLMIFSLTTMIVIASYFFSQDIELRIVENNHARAQIIASKVNSDIFSMVKTADLIADPLINQSDNSQVLKLIGEKIFTSDRDLIFICYMTFDQDKAKCKNSLFNRRFFTEYNITENMLKESLTSHHEILSQAAMGQHVLENISKKLNHPAAAIAIPIKNNSDETYDVITMIVSLPELINSVRSEGIIKTLVINQAGKVIISEDASLVLAETDLSSLPIVKEMSVSRIDNGQTRYVDGNGIKYLGSFKKIDLANIGVIATAEEGKAFRSVYLTIYRNILILVIVLGASIIIALLFSKTLTRPIHRLVTLMKKVKEGDFSYRIKKMPNDEMGILMNSFNTMNAGLSERERIKSTFGRFVNKEIAEQALHGELKLGGERKELAVFFSDIRSFTQMSESMEPEAVVTFLNDYMTRMVQCVNDTHGVVDKFIGDSIMAVWGAPVSHDNDSKNAIECALMMREALIRFNEERKAQKLSPVHMGCGINTGPALAGQIGSKDRMEYTVIGDTVNLASRIESLNKPFATDILISDETFKKVRGEYLVAKMQPITVKGKKDVIQIWAVLGRKDDPDCPKSLAALRTRLGIRKNTDTSTGTGNDGEKKYKIIKKKSSIKK